MEKLFKGNASAEFNYYLINFVAGAGILAAPLMNIIRRIFSVYLGSSSKGLSLYIILQRANFELEPNYGRGNCS